MELPLAYLLTLLCVAGSLWAVWQLIGRQAVLSPPAIFVGIYILYHVPMALSLAHESLGFLFLVDLGLICFVAGSLLASDRQPIARRTLEAFARKVYIPFSRQTLVIAFVVLVAVAGGFATLYYQGLPPYFDIVELVLEGDLATVRYYLSEGRQSLTKSHYFGEPYRGQGVFGIATQESWKYLMVLAALLAGSVGRRGYKFLAVAVVFFGYVFIAGSATRDPFVWAVIAMTIAYSYTHRMTRRSWITWGASILGILFFLTLMTPKYSLEGNVLMNIVNAIIPRIFFGNGWSTYLIYDLVQDGTLTFQYGLEHLRIFLNALPGAHSTPPLAHDILFLTDPYARPWNTSYLSHTYLGLLYIDFGVVGVSVVFVFLGWALQRLHLFVVAADRSILHMTFLAIVAQHAGRMVHTSLVNFFPPVLVLLVVHVIAVGTTRLLENSQRATESASPPGWPKRFFRRPT